MLLKGEIMPMRAHQRRQPAVLRSSRVDLLPARQKVVIDSADDMKPVRDNARLRKIFPRQRPVHRGQVDTHDLNAMPALRPGEITLQRSLAPAEHDVVDLVILQIAECRRITMTAAEEVLINAEDYRPFDADPLAAQVAQPVDKPALDGGAGDALARRQTAARNAIVVSLTHCAAAWFGGTHARQNAGKPLPERPAAATAQPFPGFQFEQSMTQAPVFMPQTSPPAILKT